jgi:hypothetical protein
MFITNGRAFPTQDAATTYASAYFAKTGIILGVEERPMVRVKRITSHVGVSRFLGQRETVGFIVRQRDIPSAYASGPTHLVFADPKHTGIIVVETRHKTYDVFAVPPELTVFATDAEATEAFMAALRAS